MSVNVKIGILGKTYEYMEMEFYTNMLLNAFRLVILQAITSLRGKKLKIVQHQFSQVIYSKTISYKQIRHRPIN